MQEIDLEKGQAIAQQACCYLISPYCFKNVRTLQRKSVQNKPSLNTNSSLSQSPKSWVQNLDSHQQIKFNTINFHPYSDTLRFIIQYPYIKYDL